LASRSCPDAGDRLRADNAINGRSTGRRAATRRGSSLPLTAQLQMSQLSLVSSEMSALEPASSSDMQMSPGWELGYDPQPGD
jgi:hypothetical protein